ncbi:hypothetical protein PR003_g10560 [Phytophthora rubi]|uniref:Pectate lyase n=1 Tax=Phytophthora rubi TaxID=129364 RepID=A0A6A3MW18_9STRA|nr:hypothetical protein PR002_g11688 [Phytophthora rubi]KAE9033363.1 hypothetical protein PR001_g10199 [Phytophthora rubi]KAE9340302.1 hypothetical protein PR003_g10560 [Phytophthora rubi]
MLLALSVITLATTASVALWTSLMTRSSSFAIYATVCWTVSVGNDDQNNDGIPGATTINWGCLHHSNHM